MMWEMILQEIINIIQKHKLILILSVLAFACACVAINSSLTWYMEEAAESTAAKETYGEKASFKIFMDGGADKYKHVFGNTNSDNVKALFEALRSDDNFTFRYTVENSVEFYDVYDPEYNSEDFPDYKEEFRVGYEWGDMIDYDDYLSLKAFYADRLFCSESGISIEEGRSFVEEDFVVTSPEHIILPVLLGNGYRDLYQIGDRIEDAHLGMMTSITLEVVGFFGEGSSFYDNNTMKQVLDRYMVVPATETSYDGRLGDGTFDDFTNGSYDFMKIINSRILCEQSKYQEVKSHVMEIFHEYGFSELYLDEESKGYTAYLKHVRENTVASTVITVFIITMIVIMICIQTYYRITRDQKKYCILMLNGITTGQLFLLIITETFLTFLLSSIVYLGTKYAFRHNDFFDFGIKQYSRHSLSAICIIEVLLLIVIGCYGVYKIRQLNMSTVLRENE